MFSVVMLIVLSVSDVLTLANALTARHQFHEVQSYLFALGGSKGYIQRRTTFIVLGMEVRPMCD
jgi:hypothetical protein